MSRPTLLIVLALAFVAGACSDSVSDSRPRIGNFDGGIADGGFVDGVTACDADEACVDGAVCVIGTIGAPPADGGVATGRCRRICDPETGEGCRGDQVCVEAQGGGACVPFSDVDSVFGAPCPGGSADCLQGVCVETPRGPLCGRPCGESTPNGSDPTCPDVATCEPLPVLPPLSGDFEVCAPVGADGSRPFEAPCPNGNADCASRICVDFGDGDVCAQDCETDADCGADRECRNDEDVDGAPVQVCGPETGVIGDPCETGMEDCRSTLCLVRSPNNVCTDECSDAMPCPEGWGCNTLRGRDGQPVDVCVPLGSIGDRCDRGMEDCLSGLCLTLGRSGVCTDRCEGGDECPGGWDCINVNGPDGAIDVCSPRF